MRTSLHACFALLLLPSSAVGRRLLGAVACPLPCPLALLPDENASCWAAYAANAECGVICIGTCIHMIFEVRFTFFKDGRSAVPHREGLGVGTTCPQSSLLCTCNA